MNKTNIKINIALGLILFLSLSSVGCNPLTNFLNEKKEEQSQILPQEAEAKPKEENLAPQSSSSTDIVTLTAVGDVMVHESQWLSQKTGENTYDFRDNFTHVKSIFQSSDLAIANLETTILPSAPIRSYPRFNSPPEILDSLKDAGFNLISTANNHSMDTGLEGIYGTLDELESRGMASFGTYRHVDHKKYVMLEKKGMKLGVSSFTTGYFQSNGVRMNNIDSNGMENYINFMSLTSVNDAFTTLEKEVEAMKDEGAEFIILYLHWGTEYEKSPDQYQKQLSQRLIDIGVDLIIGSHPHMVQDMSFIKSSDGLHEGLVCYSLGNFLSNQRNEILEMTGTEDGLIAKISLKRDDSGEVIIEKTTFIPTWIHRKDLEEDLFTYRILPLTSNTKKDSITYQCAEEDLKESLSNTLKVMKDERITMEEIIP